MRAPNTSQYNGDVERNYGTDLNYIWTMRFQPSQLYIENGSTLCGAYKNYDKCMRKGEAQNLCLMSVDVDLN